MRKLPSLAFLKNHETRWKDAAVPCATVGLSDLHRAKLRCRNAHLPPPLQYDASNFLLS